MTYRDVRICSNEMARRPVELDTLLGLAVLPGVSCMVCREIMRHGSVPHSSDLCAECRPGYEESMRVKA
jgi:hypothetical protein